MDFSIRTVLTWILALALTGCAALPDYDALSRDRVWWRTDSPRVETAQGQLSKARSEKIINGLEAQGETSLLQRHLAFMEAVSNIPLVAGNEARLLIDGPATRKAMFDAIEAAQREILIETYIFEDDDFGTALSQLLRKKRAEGVPVHVIYDSVGSVTTPATFFDEMRKANIAVCEFNPINPLRARIFSPNQRDHRKLMVLDGEVALTGGINISRVYQRGSLSFWSKAGTRNKAGQAGWRDTHIEIAGPAVGKFRELFMDTWRRQICPGIIKDETLPTASPRGDKLVRVIATSPADDQNLIYLELLSAIDHAEKSIHVTMAYFVPDPEMIRALSEAARRGVEVKLILANEGNYRMVFHAGRSKYTALLTAGVQIYEWEQATLHAKTAVIDGVWSNVGSANLDWRSFLHNDEINAVVLGEAFAVQMERQFEEDLELATPVTLSDWSQRGYGSRFKEFSARIFEYWL